MNPLDLLRFFRSEILYVYLGRPDKYSIEFGLHGGHIKSTEGAPPENLINLRFAFRELPDGELAIAAYIPDLMENTAASERLKWGCFELPPSAFFGSSDPNFEEWLSVYFKGNWASETPPLQQIVRGVEWANAITKTVAGYDIFSFRHDELTTIHFPFTNHTHAYQDAHRELYRYMFDGINKHCIQKLNDMRKNPIPKLDEMSGFKAIKHSFPSLNNSLVPALDKIGRQRSLSTHGNRPAAVKFEAYKHFLLDLQSLAKGLEDLVSALEHEFGISRQRALALAALPKHSNAPHSNPEANVLSKYFGHGIDACIVCVIKKNGEATRDALVIQFIDGSQIAISFSADVAGFLRKEAPKSTDLDANFAILDSRGLKQANIECENELMGIFIAQGIIQNCAGRKIVNFHFCDVEEESEFLPRRQLLFLDLEDGSSIVIEPTWNLGHKVTDDGVVDLSDQSLAPEDIHLQINLRYIPI